MGSIASARRVASAAPASPGWTVYENIDMCGQGDVEIIPNWKSTHTIEQLKHIVEQKGYSAFTVSNGNPSFGHAALKKFDFPLTKANCKPISQCCGHPCKIYIFSSTHSQPKAQSFCISGWTGYNERLNGNYTADGSTLNGRPVFKHMHSIGVGSGADWCRLYWAHGAWRVGHVIWVHGENKNAVAYVNSDAIHPLQIEPNAQWHEHKGRSCGADYGKSPDEFQEVNSISISSNDSKSTAPIEKFHQGSAEFLIMGLAGQQLTKVSLDLGQSVRDLQTKVATKIGQVSSPSWSIHENVDICQQGDVEIIHDWKRAHTIEQLKHIVEQKGYSAFTVSNGNPSFGHAALKKCDFPLTRDHCRPISQCCNHPCKTYIYNCGGPGMCFKLMFDQTPLNQPAQMLGDFGFAPNSCNMLTLVRQDRQAQDKLDAAIQQAGWDGDADKVERLLSEGADPNSFDGSKGNRHSALNGAARNGHVRCVELLINAKADIESKESYCGCTPLNQTCFHNRIEIARMLVRAKANLDAPCNFGTPLEMARKRNHNEIRLMIESAKAGHQV